MHEKTYPTLLQAFLLIGVFLLVTVIVVSLIIIISLSSGSDINDILTSPLMAIGLAIPTIITAIVGVIRIGGWEVFTKQKFPGLTTTLLSILLVLVFGFAIETIMNNLFPSMADQYVQMVELLKSNWFMWIPAVVLAPIFEEILFRGVFMNGFLHHYSPWKAIAISAAFFGAVHGIPAQAIPAFFIGLGLGFIYWKTKSLWLVILIHAINNGLAMTFLYLDFPTENNIGGDSILLNWGLAAVALFVSWLIFQQLQKTKSPIIEGEVENLEPNP